MAKEYRLEDDLLKKSRPKRNSKRYRRLEAALHAYQMDQYAKGIMPTFNRCERCGVMLLNPQSILHHQGGHCQKRIRMQSDIQNIFNFLRNKRFSLHDEKMFQWEIYTELMKAMPPAEVKREYVLDDKNTIDFFLCDYIGVEVKIKGQKREIYRQCERYCQFPQIGTLILITNLSMGFPPQINGKDCYILKPGMAWL